jgi:hypothetical protein
MPIDTRNATRTTVAVTFRERDGHIKGYGEIVGSLMAQTGETGNELPIVLPAVFDARGNGDGNVVSTLPGDHLNRITDYTPVVIPILEANARQGLSNEGSVGIGKDGDPMFTLQATVQNGVFVIDKHSGQPELGTVAPMPKTDLAHDMGPVVMRQREGKAGGGKGPLVSDKELSLTGHNDQTVFAVRTAQTSANGHGVAQDVTHTLDGANGQAVFTVGGYADYTQNRPTLRASGGDLGGGSEAIVVAPSVTSDQILFTQQALGEYADKGVASSIKERDHKDKIGRVVVVAPIAAVRPRRLMPIECERLMGWSDRWTERGIDEQGRDYALSDSARYKLCGNGVASPVAAWIGWRLRDTLEGHA